MKKTTFISLFIFAHIFFIVLQIHKHSQIIKESYRKQKNEQLKNELIQKKELLTHQLYTLKNRSTIQEFATEQLAMKPINLKQIKKITANE